MDKGTLIFAIGFTIMVSMYILNMTRIDSGTSQNSDSYTEKTEARQIARTGVQLAINKLRSSSSALGVVIQNQLLLGGTLDTVLIDSVPGQPDQRKVTSKGSYFGQKHKVVGIVQVPPTGLFNQNYLITQCLMEMQG